MPLINRNKNLYIYTPLSEVFPLFYISLLFKFFFKSTFMLKNKYQINRFNLVKRIILTIFFSFTVTGLMADECDIPPPSYNKDYFNDVIGVIVSGNNVIQGCYGGYNFPKVKNKNWNEWNSSDYDYVIKNFDDSKDERNYCIKKLSTYPSEENYMREKLLCHKNLAEKSETRNKNTADASSEFSTKDTSSKNNNRLARNTESKSNKKNKIVNKKRKNEQDNQIPHSEVEADSKLAKGSNSNASNRIEPYKERTNLPSQNGCISLVDSNKGDITSTSKWFILKNNCAYSVKVSWCTGLGCGNSTGSTTISGGGSYETWGGKSSLDGRIDLTYHACQLLSGNDEVNLSWQNKQCWANIQMN